jgi:fatty-acyl-CoA synthase
MYAVPMFHANAWGLPYAAALSGAAQVFSDRFLEPARILDLLDSEGVTITAGVPTIWIGVLALLEQTGRRLPHLRQVLCGGSAAPAALIAGLERHDIHLLHAWGMTETSPLASLTRLKGSMETLSPEEQLRIRAKQGVIAPTVECRIMDIDTNTELPWDGVAFGELQVRGPYITGTYYNDPSASEKFMDGWLRTGDVATIDPAGYIQLVDRTKDLVKSGGEWISSVELENEIMAHPKVAEAAVIGQYDEQTGQAIFAFVTLEGDLQGSAELETEVREHVAKRIGKLARPKRIVWAGELPKTRSGKIMRRLLRDVAEGRDLGDVSTLRDPGVMQDLQQQVGAGQGGSGS